MVSYIVIINFTYTGCVYFTKWQKPVVAKELKLLPTFMVNFGYPYNDIVICKDSTDYLTIR